VSGGPRPRPPLAVEIETLPADTELVRVHHARFAATEFNPQLRPLGRFRPFGDPVIPTMHAARDLHTALAESVFHDIPIRGTRQLPRAALTHRLLTRIAPTRDLRLITLHGHGLQRLAVTHGELIESGPTAYPWTAEWGAALHAAAPEADALTWMARRFTGRPALMLFGDRIDTSELILAAAPIELSRGDGLELVEDASQLAGIALLL
jgi:hypothetical protein